MLRTRSHSQSRGVSDSLVRAAQSTQLDVDQLELDLQSRDHNTNGRGEQGHGDVFSVKESALAQTSSSPFTRQRRAAAALIAGNSLLGSRSVRTSKRIHLRETAPFSNKGSQAQANLGTVVDNVFRVVPVVSDTFSDDANENAARKINGGRRSRNCAQVKARAKPKCEKRSRPARPRQSPSPATDGHHVIRLPPNSTVKITSQTGLCIQNKENNNRTQSPGSIKSPPPKARRSDSRARSVTSRRAGDVVTSRYRITPCPTSQSDTSGGSYVSPSCSSSTRQSCSSRMGRRPAPRARSVRSASTSRTGSTRKTSISRRSCMSGSRRSRSTASSRPRRPALRSLRSVSSMSSRMSLRRGARKPSGRCSSRRPSRAARGKRAVKSRSTSNKKRGRPRGRSSRSLAMSASSNDTLTAAPRSRGLFERLSGMWRSEKGASPAPSSAPSSAATTTKTSTSSTCSSQSWVARMLPLGRGKAAPYKHSRREKARHGTSDARSKRDGTSKQARAQTGSVVCAIM